MRKLAIVWENFGPIHADRCDAIQRKNPNQIELTGIEIFGISETYEWKPEPGKHFRKVTLFPGLGKKVGELSKFVRLLRACISLRCGYVFLCNYEMPSTFALAIALRVLGIRVFVMNDSKFDDYKRYFWREFGKRIFYAPYQGALASGYRSKDYLRFLGIPENSIVGVYNSMSISRVRELGAAGGTLKVKFADRYFAIVARLVKKKNISTAISAYDQYRSQVASPRRMHIYGSGPLERELKAQVERLGLSDMIVFFGFLQTAEICRELAKSLALLLPSVEEQFGNVVIEAQALGIPVILSTNCGACDILIRTGVNGFIVESENTEGYAFFMKLLSQDEALWQSMSTASDRFVDQGDADRFAEAVSTLINRYSQ